MSIQDDQLIYEYLGRVADAAQGRLAPLDRVQLVEDVRLRIETERGRGSPVPRILAQLGPAEALVARSVGHDRQGYPPTQTMTAPMDQTFVIPGGTDPGARQEDGLPAYSGLVLPEVSPAEDGGNGSRNSPWRRGVRSSRGSSSRGERSWSSIAHGPGSPIDVVRGRNLLEITALLFYTVGTLVISYVGFLIAVGLTLMSKVWSEREKGVAIALAPALSLGAGIFVVWISQDRSGTTEQRFDRAMSALGDFFGSWPWVAGFLAAGYLLVKLFLGNRRPAG